MTSNRRIQLHPVALLLGSASLFGSPVLAQALASAPDAPAVEEEAATPEADPFPAPIAAAIASVDPDVREYNDHLTFLAHPFLEGRLPGTRGMEIAKDYCEHYLRECGLEAPFVDEAGQPSYRQPFELATRSVLSDQALDFGDGDWIAGDDFQAMSLGRTGTVRAPIVFVGYSIDRGQGEYSSYDDGDDLTGKIAMALRFEPMDEQGESLWARGRSPWSARASFNRKVRDAAERGAAGVLIVNTPGANDPRVEQMTGFQSGGETAEVPVFMVSTDVARQIVATAPGDASLEDLVRRANQGRVIEPLDVEIELSCTIDRNPLKAENVAGLLPGKGRLAEELVVIGAHLDHLGMGDFGSRDSENRGKLLHPGADDNASGSAALLMLAERLQRDYTEHLTEGVSARSVLIVLFSGEESGLNGSKHYVDEPIRPLEAHALMMNFDMIGRIENARLNVSGTDTGVGMADWAQPFFDASPLEVVDSLGARGGSDHLPFLGKDIPVLFGIIADFHDDYHTPRDTSDKINREAAVEAMRLWHSLALSAALRPDRFEFAEEEESPDAEVLADGEGPSAAEGVEAAARPLSADRPSVRLGIMPGNYTEEGNGVLVERLTPGGSAEAAGILAGDRLWSWNDEALTDAGLMMQLLREHEPGDQVRIEVEREGVTERLVLTVELQAIDDQG